MFQLVVLSVLAGLALSGCSRPPEATSPQQVSPGEVKSILLTENALEASRCVAELQGQGARVLYRGATGLLMTDRAASDLRLSACEATATPNTSISLGLPPSASSGSTPSQKPDLATLMKLIPAEVIGARSFVKQNPEQDGRGAIIAVLDTGVEMNHPMLTKTSTGKPKLIANADFSGEGRVVTSDVTLSGSQFTVGGRTYDLGANAPAAARFGIFPGSSLVYSEDIAAKDDYVDLGVAVFKAADGTWHGKIDTDDDGDLGEEAELFDFSRSQATTKIGAKKTLTVALNIADDGATASLVFDDGGHGTHVAGIAAGYDANGLQGVAPGAQVIGAKIGDNRLSGGSTTTASMLLAIDYAAAQGAHIINMSYGIRAGSNVGLSTIDRYVDKVAKDKGILFAISAGNEGPGLLTIGTPAGAELAITNAAYLPKETGHLNYGYTGLARDTLWYFSSVGPLLDGGWKPTLLAPGTALSSIPGWTEGAATYSGTSMSSPHVAGGLALVVSAAKAQNLPSDRASVTRAVYRSATRLKDLMLIEQGNGLMNIPAAVRALKADAGELAVEYSLSVNSPTAPGGKGKGIYVRGAQAPANAFAVVVSPRFPASATESEKTALKTYRLEASASWIQAPAAFYLLSAPRSFRVQLGAEAFAQPGLHSESLKAVDEATGKVAFEVPVTVVVPHTLEAGVLEIDATMEVGTTQRFFVAVPPGTTALQADLESPAGHSVWAQLLDSEGRHVLTLQDANRTNPQPVLLGQSNLSRAGVYELDIVAPPFNPTAAPVRVKLKAFQLQIQRTAALGPKQVEITVENHGGALRLTPKAEVKAVSRRSVEEVLGDTHELKVEVTAEDLEKVDAVELRIQTAKAIYDRMTDYPYMLLGVDDELIGAGGLALDDTITLDDVSRRVEGTYRLRVTGAFAEANPKAWVFSLTESRRLLTPIKLLAGAQALVESGQALVVPLDLTRAVSPLVGFEACAELSLTDGGGRLIQTETICP